MTMNNARLRCLGAFLPVHSIEVVDAKQKIWKGVPIMQFGQRDEPAPFVFFSREYLPDINDFDKVYHEFEIKSETVLGEGFWLIPKEKLLFAYEPPTGEGILLPPAKVVKLRGRQ